MEQANRSHTDGSSVGGNGQGAMAKAPVSLKVMQPAAAQNNIGLCRKCQKRVPAGFEIRDNKVYLVKQCPECGATDSLVSNDAAAWQAKRDIWQYQDKPQPACSLHCDRCNVDHSPTVVFLDVTNRCNMNCPICIANIRGMGFEFNPPLEYFDKVFAAIGKLNPSPFVELFGGEPTTRKDLLQIIRIGRKYGVKPRVVTNGLKLADEKYCKELCDAGVRVRLGFDGRNPEMYRKLRKSDKAYEKKLQAIANLRKYSTRKHAIIACASRDHNETHMADFFEFLHEYRDVFNEMGIIPLTENWEPGAVESVTPTSREDVEHMVERAIPGGGVEFVPAGLVHGLRKARSFFRPKTRSEYLMLGGVHPNCESFTILISDGDRYVSVNKHTKVRMRDIAKESLAIMRDLEPKLDRLDVNKRWQRWRGQWMVLRKYAPLFLRAADLKRIVRGRPILTALRMVLGLLRGRKLEDLYKTYLIPQQALRIAVLPFEEYHSIDAAKLEHCKAVFAYQDVNDGQIKFMPACTWYMYRNENLRKMAERYGLAPDLDDFFDFDSVDEPAGAAVGLT